MIQEKSIYAILEEIKPLNILLVDDDLASQFIIAKSLDTLGDNLDMCSSPEEALDRIAEKRYDLILVDMLMPQMDGLTFLKTIKEDLGREELVIMISAHNPVGDESLNIIQGGAYDILHKPFTPSRLKITLRNALAFKKLLDKYKELKKAKSDK